MTELFLETIFGDKNKQAGQTAISSSTNDTTKENQVFKIPTEPPSKTITKEDASLSKKRIMPGMTAMERHMKYIKDYVLFYGKGNQLMPNKDNNKTDHDVLRENYRFIRSEEDNNNSSWEKRLAKKYHDKLFKEYCLADMSRYKEGKIGMRWRTQEEVFKSKGQLTCGNKACNNSQELKSYEVNFAYVEDGEKKNALVKLRVCSECADKLNYKKLKREQKERKKEEKKRKKQKLEHPTMEKSDKGELDANENKEVENAKLDEQPSTDKQVIKQKDEKEVESERKKLDSNAWTHKPEIEKTKEDEFDEYFEGLFL